jgi:putative redox protein
MARMTVTRINDAFAFNAVDEAHNSMILDIPVDQGGHGTGLRPMQTLLSALGACSGVDIVMILNKQKETIEFFEILFAVDTTQKALPKGWRALFFLRFREQ